MDAALRVEGAHVIRTRAVSKETNPNYRSMKYELAKQLKEAGYPQMGSGDALVLHDEASFENLEDETMSVIPWCQYVYRPSKRADVMYAPTLSELIEAFEDIPHNSFQSISTDGYGWDAEAAGGENASGQTPEEAVANLWLLLHHAQ